jgi:hypothetical protein
MRRQVTSVVNTVAALLLLVGVLIVVAYVQMRTSVTQRAAATERLKLAANLAARVGGAEIDRRWRMLEFDAADRQLNSLVKSLNEKVRAFQDEMPDPAKVDAILSGEDLDKLEAHLMRRFICRSQEEGVALVAMTLVLSNGTQAVRIPNSKQSRFGNFAYRSYFHGNPLDLPVGSRAPISTQPVISPVYISKSTKLPNITLSVPIINDSGDTIGRLCMAIGVGQVGMFSELSQKEVPMLVESRKYDVGGIQATGLIADHPNLEAADVTASKIPQVSPEELLDLRGTKLIENFKDPLSNYYGEAVAAPVMISGRAAEPIPSGWVVIIHPNTR